MTPTREDSEQGRGGGRGAPALCSAPKDADLVQVPWMVFLKTCWTKDGDPFCAHRPDWSAGRVSLECGTRWTKLPSYWEAEVAGEKGRVSPGKAALCLECERLSRDSKHIPLHWAPRPTAAGGTPRR